MTVKSPDTPTSLLWELSAKRLIGRRVTKRMKEMGYESDEALAHDAQVVVKTIWRLRNGKSYPRESTAQPVAAALQMPIEELRPPLDPDDDPELREQLAEVLSRLERIELAVGVPQPDQESAVAEELELDEEQAAQQSESTALPSGEPKPGAASG